MNTIRLDPNQLIEFMTVALEGVQSLAADKSTRPGNTSIAVSPEFLQGLQGLLNLNPNWTLADYTRAAILAEIEAMV